jgi:serine protease inhibitor
MKILSVFLATLALAACHAQPANDRTAPADSLQHAHVAGSDPLTLFMLLENEAAPGDNVVYSPVSTMQAIGLVQLGAHGDTSAQIDAVLGLSAGEAGAARLKGTREALVSDTQGASVSIANALLLTDDYQFAPAYADAASRLFAAETETIDFRRRPGEAVAAINGWAKEATEGLVPQVVDQASLNQDAAAYLANATFFEADWHQSFRSGRDAPFLFGDGSERDFYLMEGRLSVPYAELQGWRAVRLAYGSPGAGKSARFVMDVMMSTQRVADLPTLGRETIANIAAGLVTASPRNVLVEMPRFEAGMRRDLIEPLRALGLSLPFDRAHADLSGMSAPGSKRLYIEEAFQVAKLQIYEQGTRAAAVTVAVPVPVSMPPPFEGAHFTVDRPFVFIIRDLQTDTVLFIGRIASPDPYKELERPE